MDWKLMFTANMDRVLLLAAILLRELRYCLTLEISRVISVFKIKCTSGSLLDRTQRGRISDGESLDTANISFGRGLSIFHRISIDIDTNVKLYQ